MEFTIAHRWTSGGFSKRLVETAEGKAIACAQAIFASNHIDVPFEWDYEAPTGKRWWQFWRRRLGYRVGQMTYSMTPNNVAVEATYFLSYAGGRPRVVIEINLVSITGGLTVVPPANAEPALEFPLMAEMFRDGEIEISSVGASAMAAASVDARLSLHGDRPMWVTCDEYVECDMRQERAANRRFRMPELVVAS